MIYRVFHKFITTLVHIFNYDFLALAMKEYYGLLLYTGSAYRVMYEKHECIRKVDTITFLSLHVSSNKFMKYLKFTSAEFTFISRIQNN